MGQPYFGVLDYLGKEEKAKATISLEGAAPLPSLGILWINVTKEFLPSLAFKSL